MMKPKMIDKYIVPLLWIIVIFILSPIINAASINKAESGRNLRRHSKSSSSRRSSSSNSNSIDNSLPLKPSLVMVPLDLHESANSDLDPDVDNLDKLYLLDIMGKDYDSHFMSLRKPLEMTTKPNGTLLYQFTKDTKSVKGVLPPELEDLSSKTVRLSDDGIELRIKFSRKTKKKLQKFLWSYSYCPVRYTWKKLSIRFWPQWIKEGRCDNKRSCSIPAGMTCQPAETVTIKLLRYYCPSSSPCQWIKIDYPILSECSCGCTTYSDYDYS